ncbi:hypothetical protein ABFP25_09385 [Acinetobacter indicus]|jgi:hypothetical protein|uniref:hypothetical protein n=1 Tax=Acinetobacter indicus TaxID=756892 RepID=UPI0032132472
MIIIGIGHAACTDEEHVLFNALLITITACEINNRFIAKNTQFKRKVKLFGAVLL